jgi:hypothetical protein
MRKLSNPLDAPPGAAEVKLTKGQHKWREWLRDRGGSGVVDSYGRVHAMGENSPTGAQVAWLHLLAKGVIDGGDGRIWIKEGR